MTNPELSVELSSASSIGEPMRCRLDILQDCADLQGTFPKNVELKFIYWEHGGEDDGETPEDKASRLAAHCMSADRIGCEVATTFRSDPREVQQEYKIINDIIAGRKPNKTIDEMYGKLEGASSSLFFSLALDRAMKARGRRKSPKFFPFDKFEFIQDVEKDVILDGLSAKAQHRVAGIRDRENHALRQLFYQAKMLGRDGRQHQIAVIYGAYHTPVSVAARELGANTTRIFVDKPSFSVNISLERELRYQNLDELNPPVNAYESAERIGFLMRTIAADMGIKQKKGLDQPSHFSTLGALVLKDFRGVLLPEDKKNFNSNCQVIEPYLPYGTRVPILKRRVVKKALRQLVTLAEKLY